MFSFQPPEMEYRCKAIWFHHLVHPQYDPQGPCHREYVVFYLPKAFLAKYTKIFVRVSLNYLSKNLDLLFLLRKNGAFVITMKEPRLSDIGLT